jgi:UrcA family protein
MKATSSTRLATCLSAAALAIAGLMLANDCAFAQQNEQITVVPPFSNIRREHRTHDRIYLTQWVGHSDLDLRTDWGVQALGARIGYAAQENCKLLDRYYLDSMSPAAKATRKQNCVANAVYGAQAQFSTAVFAARQ